MENSEKCYRIMGEFKNKTRALVTSAFLVGIAVLFQLMPVLFTEAFVLMTMLSALPIYIISSIEPRLGVAGFIAAVLIIMLFSVHEGLFFMCTNGIVGVTLGIAKHYNWRKMITIFFSASILTVTLCIMNYGIGVPVFGMQIPGIFLTQLVIIVVFSTVYCCIYLLFCNFIFSKLTRMYKF